MNAITATTAACTAVSGGRVRVRVGVGLVAEGRATSRSLAALGMTKVGLGMTRVGLGMTKVGLGMTRVGLGMTSVGRALRQAMYRRDTQGWRPVDAVLALGIAARTQCCPSKHPDGYRETVIRR